MESSVIGVATTLKESVKMAFMSSVEGRIPKPISVDFLQERIAMEQVTMHTSRFLVVLNTL
jgi:hypothetical protein